MPGVLAADTIAAMDFLYNVVVLVHLLGMAAVVGAYASTFTAPRATELMVWGARVTLLAGIVIVGLGEGVKALDKDYNMAKIGVKLIVALAVVACAEIARARQKRNEPAANLVHVAGGLAVLNVFVAVLWT